MSWVADDQAAAVTGTQGWHRLGRDWLGAWGAWEAPPRGKRRAIALGITRVRPPWSLVRSSEGAGAEGRDGRRQAPRLLLQRVRSQVIKLPLVMHGVRLAKTPSRHPWTGRLPGRGLGGLAPREFGALGPT